MAEREKDQSAEALESQTSPSDTKAEADSMNPISAADQDLVNSASDSEVKKAEGTDPKVKEEADHPASEMEAKDAEFQKVSEEEFQSERKEQKQKENEKTDAVLSDRKKKRDERARTRAQERAESRAAKEQARADAAVARLKAKADVRAAREKAKADAKAARLKSREDAKNAKQQAKDDAKAAKVKAKEDAKAAKEKKKADKKAEKHARWVANRPKRIRRTIITLIILVLVVGGAGYGYQHYAKYFRNHFYNGTSINGVDVSYLTADDVKKRLEKTVSSYSLTINERGGKEKITADQIGWKYKDDGSVDTLLSNQKSWKWVSEMARSRDYKVPMGTSYDQDKAKDAIQHLECLTGDVTKPEDATIRTKEDGTYEIVPEVEGNEVDSDKLMQTVLTALNDGKKSVSLEKKKCYVEPKIRKDDKTLNSRMKIWNKYMGTSLVYTFGDQSETIDGNYIKQYLTDNGTKVTLATDWIKMLVYSWSEKYNTFGKARQFKTHAGNQITLPSGGDYGWYLNTDKTIDDVTKAVKNGESGTKSPVWLFQAQGWDNGDITGTYIEISLQDQKLWLYKDGQQVLETDVVTGAPSSDRETKPGIYSIDEKTTNVLLSSEDMQDTKSPVSCWLPFDGGQGIHDAAWRDAFGGTIYQTNGSYGNVNVPEDEIQTIYNAVQVGTAVVVY